MLIRHDVAAQAMNADTLDANDVKKLIVQAAKESTLAPDRGCLFHGTGAKAVPLRLVSAVWAGLEV
jgi:hypothetical protein